MKPDREPEQTEKPTGRYLDRGSNGEERHTSGKYLDACGAGLVVSAGGARTVICWSSLNVVQLTEG